MYQMKKVLSIFLVVLMVISSFAMFANAGVGDNLYTEKEVNNTMKEANLIYDDYTVSGVVADQYDIDYFKFTLSKETQISFLCQSSYSTVSVLLCDSSGKVLGYGVSDSKNGNHYDTIVTTLPSGTYYIAISQSANYVNVSYLFYFEMIKSAKHTHSYVITSTKPTCTEPAYKTYYCACKFNFVTAGDPPTGHWESTWLELVPATCDAEGSKYKRCITCGEILGIEATPKASHADKDNDGVCDICKDELADCSCLCHNEGLIGTFFRNILAFLKIFNIAKVCGCGVGH